MQTFQSVFERELRKLIAARIDEMKDMLAAGMNITAIENYRQVVGEIRGLGWALEAFEEANEKAANAERGQ